ncbi:VIP1 kinase, partial [Polyodon spathula]|nr:VIP1 kinase [Polyodon spathula]
MQTHVLHFLQLSPTGSTSVLNSMKLVGNPVQTCDRVYALIQSLTSQIRTRLEDPKSADLQLYHSETLELMLQRWSKLERDFRMKSGRYDISKIPDIYDCIKYDVQHNSSLGLEDTLELFRLSKALADIIIPQEYGIDKEEKLDIAYTYCLPLIKKIQLDMQRTHEDESVNKLHPLYSRGVMSPGRHVRTRLYFTSESHVHSLLSVFRYGGLLDELNDQQWKRAMDYLGAVSELNYMTQIVIMIYEDNNKDPSSEERFHVELHFSPGNEEKQTDPGSIEDLSHDEPDRAVPLSEPIGIHRKSLLTRTPKAGSMEVLSETSSSKSGGYRLFPSYSRQSPEMKQSGLGSQCTGLFSTTVLGGSSSAPNLQDYARTHRKKFSGSLFYKDELIKMDSKHQYMGFEGCSMVPSIYPLETLHNSLSLKQVNEFLTAVCESGGDSHSKASKALSDIFDPQSQPPVYTFTPQRVLSSSVSALSLRHHSDRPAWYSSGPSSTVSSAGPSSPTTADASPRFSFSDKMPLTPQSSDEAHVGQQSKQPTGNSQTSCQPVDTSLLSGQTDSNPSSPQQPSGQPVVSTSQSTSPNQPNIQKDQTASENIEQQGLPLTQLAGLERKGANPNPLGSLGILLEDRESESETAFSAQSAMPPEEPEEFFDTHETLEVWENSPSDSQQHPESSLELGVVHVSDP